MQAGEDDATAAPEDALTSLGSLFNLCGQRSQRTFTFGPHTVVLRLLDDDHPGALQSGCYLWPAASALASFSSRGPQSVAYIAGTPATRTRLSGAGGDAYVRIFASSIHPVSATYGAPSLLVQPAGGGASGASPTTCTSVKREAWFAAYALSSSLRRMSSGDLFPYSSVTLR